MSKVRLFFEREEIKQEIKKAENLLADAFEMFNVPFPPIFREMPLLTTTQIGANVQHIQLQEELGRVLKHDRRQLLAYLDHLLKTKRTLALEIENSPPISLSHNTPWTNNSKFSYPSPITPASSTSWRLCSDVVYQVDGGDPLPEGTVGQVCRRAMHGKARIITGDIEFMVLTYRLWLLDCCCQIPS